MSDTSGTETKLSPEIELLIRKLVDEHQNQLSEIQDRVKVKFLEFLNEQKSTEDETRIKRRQLTISAIGVGVLILGSFLAWFINSLNDKVGIIVKDQLNLDPTLQDIAGARRDAKDLTADASKLRSLIDASKVELDIALAKARSSLEQASDNATQTIRTANELNQQIFSNSAEVNKLLQSANDLKNKVVLASDFIKLADSVEGNINLVAEKAVRDPSFQQAIAERSAMPRDSLVFFDSQTCPSGWREDDRFRGRYIVGVTAGGRKGLAVGQALKDGENRPTGYHTHRYQDFSVGGDPPPSSDIAAGNAVPRKLVPRTTEGPDGDPPAGTNAPFVQLLACLKV